MSRQNDINALVTAAREQYQAIRKGYDAALRDQSMDLRVPVKNLMENLRSALDYMSHDIFEKLCRPSLARTGTPEPRNVYFPYGRTEGDFKSALGRSLPDLGPLSPAVYGLILGIQPFRCGNNWLYDLCSVLNEKKHDRLTPQVRTETETYSVVSRHGSVSVPVNNPNFRITSTPGVSIFGVPAQFAGDGIRTAPSPNIRHERTRWVAFTFDGTNVNVIGLLDRSVDGVADIAAAIYKAL